MKCIEFFSIMVGYDNVVVHQFSVPQMMVFLDFCFAFIFGFMLLFLGFQLRDD